ncbi:4'-phosphopantetheinyl transferase family protein [Marimonas lutisalis]|uniref:4'-phosphopantetheinyl transferase family protein n=1 Tax=Marimonas lutisalis TaxID=2545756 RepID=UPI0010F6E1B4|nr:4'-phosphopantetheinyl transferase superfamily protein [Marimonas lutisalis]
MALDSGVLDQLEAALGAVLPGEVAVAVEDPSAGDAGLFAAEAAAVARAVPKRRAEFAAGRRAAHRAMEALGHLAAPVTMEANRAPVWPDGLIGSISHCNGGCAALVARGADLRAVAIDLEDNTNLPREVLPMVCLPAERAWIDRLAPERRMWAARLIFSAKECAYKLQFPITRKMLDFADLQVDIDLPGRRFRARFLDHQAPFCAGETLDGQIDWHGTIIHSVMILR